SKFAIAAHFLILAMAKIKKCAAIANFEAGKISRNVKNAIVKSCEEILEGKLADQFPLPNLQGGAGTSINANVNEVIASRATEILQKQGKKTTVHPNDHVNASQSTNDVNPSALKIALFDLLKSLDIELSALAKALEIKAKEFKNIWKLGRTHLQDAVPTTLGAEFASFAEIVRRRQGNVRHAAGYAEFLNLGGTAIGNSINASPKYIKAVYRELNKISKGNFRPAENLMSKTSSQTDFLIISQAIVALTADLSKIANDFKLLSSGPKGGFGEIVLPELQKGSSIMPGKTNPVIPELINQLYFIVSGNNLTIERCVEASQLELGVMLPTISERLLESVKTTIEALTQFTKLCVAKIRANKARCRQLLESSTAYATLLVPKLGYDIMSEIVKEALRANKTIRQLVLEKKLLTNKEFDNLVQNLF
ncbi:MAG: lyase family protein, partial [Candidatus Doudnabacteria bacterium]|nr:lyase family protein [Candidatus Doudnabacteria bacterium]